MGSPTGFLDQHRVDARRRPVAIRLRDWREVVEHVADDQTAAQAGRCMDCGVPFCHQACPLGNLIPEWNDLVHRGDWARADERLHATNNFPELTGRLCPAPCEGSCVLELDDEAVAIERVELEVAERAFAEGWIVPVRAAPTGRTVGVVGSGPAGLAAAQQLARAGHAVTVFERAEAPGGLLRYGIPPFKLDKRVLDRRLAQLRAEGVMFRCATSVGAAHARASADGATELDADELVGRFDAVVLALGSTEPRDLELPGRSLDGVVLAMDYLRPSNLAQEGPRRPTHTAAGRDVVILGGGDTGSDCLGTALRQGARSVRQLEIQPEPPRVRSADNPWPTWPRILRTSSSHEEGGERGFGVETRRFVGADGSVTGIETVRAGARGETEGTELVDAQLVLLALGFLGPEPALLGDLGLASTERGTVAVDADWTTSRPRVFACGDAVRGQSLVVWAIAEGRSCAAAVDRALMGTSELVAPVRPYEPALV